MAKSIYDVLNIVDVYVEITHALYSSKPLYWKDIADIQKQIELLLRNNALNSAIYKEVINLLRDNYENLLETINIRRNQLFNVIDLFKIENNESIFKHKLDELVDWKYRQYKTQLIKTTTIRQEYESFDKGLDSAFYGLKDEEFEQLVKHNEREKKVLKPILDIETVKLDNLFREHDSFSRNNTKYISAKHNDLLNYLDNILTRMFVRESVRKATGNIKISFIDQLFDQSIIKSIYSKFGDKLFVSVDKDTFIQIFQGVNIGRKMDIKPKMILKVYFLISSLSTQIEEEKSREAWLTHITSSINWNNNLSTDQILRVISQKRNSADPNFKATITNILAKTNKSA